eukprot:CAMPEP_0197654354 /NCGR_PEP_ID=MMETSP1338-20131121/38803_1 /TAXON_ID=43686 ORGANISM="Pelagodinium beii, Strain RCC1491" /NCGR_SAMPLE_ID=MMETSP1338 /ASSEMBLY_ACC=CAM_ASM_000754 /LENGTH=148 /DNA_ID=CAMNT_0043229791 /DNA_START=46 /DNA_END=492 /DNA_ORIENTATION=+
MVVKTDVCAFAETKVYPGHGIRFIRKDGQVLVFASSKSRAMYNDRKKPGKLVWTQTWRRLNKKGKTTVSTKRRTRRAHKVVRAVGAMTADEILRRRATRPTATAKTQKIKDIRERRRQDRAARRAAKRNRGAARQSGGAARNIASRGR